MWAFTNQEQPLMAQVLFFTKTVCMYTALYQPSDDQRKVPFVFSILILLQKGRKNEENLLIEQIWAITWWSPSKCKGSVTPQTGWLYSSILCCFPQLHSLVYFLATCHAQCDLLWSLPRHNYYSESENIVFFFSKF